MRADDFTQALAALAQAASAQRDRLLVQSAPWVTVAQPSLAQGAVSLDQLNQPKDDRRLREALAEWQRVYGYPIEWGLQWAEPPAPSFGVAPLRMSGPSVRAEDELMWMPVARPPAVMVPVDPWRIQSP